MFILDKRSHNGLNDNDIQDENFHELHRWKPPVRLIPFDPSRIARIPSKRIDSTESDAGSGKSSPLSCDDEDGDCGETNEKEGISSGDGFEVKTITSSPENEHERPTESNAIVFTVSKSEHPLTLQMTEGDVDSTSTLNGVLSTTKATSLSAKGASESTSKPTEYRRIETVVSTKTNNVGYDRRKMKTAPVTRATAMKYRVMPISRKVARTTPSAISLLYSDRESVGTSTVAANIVAKKVDTTIGTQKRRKSRKGKNFALSTSPLISLTITATGTGEGTNGGKKLEKSFTTNATSYRNRTFLRNNGKQRKDFSTRPLNSSFIVGGSKGLADNEANARNLTTARSLLHVDHNIMLKRIESIQQALESNSSHLFQSIMESSNRSIIHKQVAQMSIDFQMKGKTYTNVNMSPKTPETKVNRSAAVLDGVALENSLQTQRKSFQSINAYIYENNIENIVSNLCLGITCKAGGICRDYGANRGRCLCPIGTGGKYCDKGKFWLML